LDSLREDNAPELKEYFMTTKTGDKTKAQIIADNKVDGIQWNKNLNWHTIKGIKTAEEFVPAVSGNWDVAPSTQDAGLNELASRVKVLENEVLESTVTLTAAQVKTLNATPVTIVAAPAAGEYIQILKVECLPTGTTGYDGVAAGEDLLFYYDTGSTALTVETDSWLDQNTPALRIALPAVAAINPLTAKAIKATISSGELFTAAGDHGLKIKIWYSVHTALT
jgi:hypothetical protein